MNALHHIELNVSNLKKSFEFYQWLFSYLGYSLYQDWDKGFSFIKDGTYLVFVQTEERFLSSIYHRKHTGLNHIAFRVDTNILRTLHNACLQRGVTTLYDDRYPHAGGHHEALFIEDPDRIKLEFSNE